MIHAIAPPPPPLPPPPGPRGGALFEGHHRARPRAPRQRVPRASRRRRPTGGPGIRSSWWHSVHPTWRSVQSVFFCGQISSTGVFLSRPIYIFIIIYRWRFVRRQFSTRIRLFCSPSLHKSYVVVSATHNLCREAYWFFHVILNTGYPGIFYFLVYQR